MRSCLQHRLLDIFSAQIFRAQLGLAKAEEFHINQLKLFSLSCFTRDLGTGNVNRNNIE